MHLRQLSLALLATAVFGSGSSCVRAAQHSVPTWHATARCLTIPNRNQVEFVALLELPVRVELYHDRGPQDYRRALRLREGSWRTDVYWRPGAGDSLQVTLLYPYEHDQFALQPGRREWTGRYSVMNDAGYEERRGLARAASARCRKLPLAPPNGGW